MGSDFGLIGECVRSTLPVLLGFALVAPEDHFVRLVQGRAVSAVTGMVGRGQRALRFLL